MVNTYNDFEFIGKMEIRKDTDKFKSYEKQIFDTNDKVNPWISERLLINVKADTSSTLVEISDGYRKSGYKLKKKGVSIKNDDGSYTKGTDIEIPWKDRNTKVAINKVAKWQRYVLDLSNNKERYEIRTAIKSLKEDGLSEEEQQKLFTQFDVKDLSELEEMLEDLEGKKQEFLSRVDMIAAVQKAIKENPNMKWKISGRPVFNQSAKNNKVYRTWEVQTIEKALPEDKVGLKANIDIFFNESSLDESSFDDIKKYIINGYVRTYDSQLKQDIYVPQQFIMDASKLDLDNPIHKGRIDFLTNEFRDCEEDVIYHLQYVVRITRGAEKKEITYDDLTDKQKLSIDCRITTLEELVKRLGGNKFGDNIDETRLINYNLKDFPEGREETDLHLEDMLVDKQSALSTNNNTETESNIEEPSSDDDVEDLL